MPARRALLFLLAALLCALLPALAAAAPRGAHTGVSTRHAAHATRQRCSKRRHARRVRICRAARPAAGAHHPALTGVATRPASTPSSTRRHAGHSQSMSGALTVGSTSSDVPASVAASTAPCANADTMPTADNLAVVEAATLCLINQVRGQHGLPALAANAQLQASAVRHNNDMVAQNYFAHNGPAGDTPESRIQDSGYLANSGGGYEIGENIAWGTGTDATPQAIVQAWVNSPEHLANILDANYADSGLAVAAQAPASVSGGAAGAVYTQDFGGITGSGN